MAGRMRSGFSTSRAASAVLVVVALVIIALVFRGFLTPSAPVAPILRTAVVTRADVRSVVPETGTLVPVSQQNVDFREPGQLTSVRVQVGDHVKAGQVLATIDDRALNNALAQAQQREAQDAATLGNTISGNQVATAEHNVAAAQTALTDVQRQTALTNQQDAVTVAQDQAFLGRDAGILARDQATLTHDTALLARDRAAIQADSAQLQQDQKIVADDQAQVAKDQGRVTIDQTRLQQDQGAVSADQARLQQDQAAAQAACPPAVPGPPSSTCTADEAKVSSDQSQLSSDEAKVSSDQNQLSSDEKQLASDQKQLAKDQAPLDQDQTQLQTDSTQLSVDSAQVSIDQQLVAQDSPKVEQDQSNLRADLQKQAADKSAGQTQVNQAQAQLTSAQDALTAQTTNRTYTIAEEQAVVAADKAAVDTAQQNVQETTLVAPLDGTVASINGTPGEEIGTGQTQTPLAPGSSAPLPNSNAGGALGGAGLSSGGAPAFLPPALIVLTDVHSFQVVTTVPEGVTAQMQPGQDANFRFSAVPGLTVPGQVLSIQPDATINQGVTNYLVTLSLDNIDKRLRAGMTASADVAVGEAKQVLTVPKIAIEHSGGSAYVTVVHRDGTQQRVPVTTGLVGDTTTEIQSGVAEGDHVLLPAVNPPGASNQPLS